MYTFYAGKILLLHKNIRNSYNLLILPEMALSVFLNTWPDILSSNLSQFVGIQDVIGNEISRSNWVRRMRALNSQALRSKKLQLKKASYKVFGRRLLLQPLPTPSHCGTTFTCSIGSPVHVTC